MPWTPAEFKRRHWQDATDAQAARAARTANAYLRARGDSPKAAGIAVRIGIDVAKAHDRRVAKGEPR